jgi:tetratricopeptide (TPR) repeat protein
MLGNLDQALADCDEAIWHDRKLAVALLYKGQVHAARNEPDKAVAACTQALQLDPLLRETLLVRGEAHWARSDVVASLAVYNAALELEDDAAARHGRGRALIARGEYDKALADFNAALRLDPNYAPAYGERGKEWLRRGEIEKGYADFAEAVRRQPKLIDDLLAFVERRAAELAKDERHETAADLCQQALVLAAPLVADHATAKKLIVEGLAAAKTETNAGKRAVLLRETILRVRTAIPTP